jgi:hypothetical protein
MSDNPLGIAVTTARAHVLCEQYSHGVPGDGRHLERQDRHAHHVRLEDIVFQGESIHGSCVGASSASQLGNRACVRERARAVVTQQVSLLLLIIFQFDFTVCLFSWHPVGVYSCVMNTCQRAHLVRLTLNAHAVPMARERKAERQVSQFSPEQAGDSMARRPPSAKKQSSAWCISGRAQGCRGRRRNRWIEKGMPLAWSVAAIAMCSMALACGGASRQQRPCS